MIRRPRNKHSRKGMTNKRGVDGWDSCARRERVQRRVASGGLPFVVWSEQPATKHRSPLCQWWKA